MALLGVIAGIRGNFEALQAVLAELRRQHVARIVCAGDVVGFNADPAECAALLRAHGVVPVAGRNDLIAVRRLGFGGCSDAEAHSLRQTRRTLAPNDASWLGSLPTHQVLDGTAVALVHAGVRDVSHPLSEPDDFRVNAEYLRYDFPGARVCFFGRGDGPLAYEVDGNVVHALEGTPVLALDRSLVHFIHPGCVDGQAAGAAGGRFARFALFDTLDWTVQFARVPYDAASTEAKAAVFGYRMTGFAARLAALQRRLRLGGPRPPRSGAGAPAPRRAPGRRGSASTP